MSSYVAHGSRITVPPELLAKLGVFLLTLVPIALIGDGARALGGDLVLIAGSVAATGLVWRQIVRPMLDTARHVSRNVAKIDRIDDRLYRIEQELGIIPEPQLPQG